MRCFILILICDDRLSTRVWQKWNIWNFLGKFFYRKWVIWLHFLAQSPMRYLEIKTGLTSWKFCMMIKYYNQTKVKYVKFSILGPRHCNCVSWDVLDSFLNIVDGDSVSKSDKCEIYGILKISTFIGEWVISAWLWV